EGGERVFRDKRCGRAARERVVLKPRPLADGDEQVARFDLARVDADAGDLARAVRDGELAGGQLPDVVERERDHVAAPSRRSTSRATSRSSNGIVRSANSWPCSWPFPAIRTTSPSAASERA